MTEQELRELDAWIAENVFGWKWWHFTEAKASEEWCELLAPLSTWPKSHNQYTAKVVESKPIGLQDDSYPPHYSTDRAASQEVLERCAEKLSPYAVTIEKLHDGWEVDFTTMDTFPRKAETLPLAICLFSKKLFGKE